jgi:hypothetical protein
MTKNDFSYAITGIHENMVSIALDYMIFTYQLEVLKKQRALQLLILNLLS